MVVAMLLKLTNDVGNLHVYHEYRCAMRKYMHLKAFVMSLVMLNKCVLIILNMVNIYLLVVM